MFLFVMEKSAALDVVEDQLGEVMNFSLALREQIPTLIAYGLKVVLAFIIFLLGRRLIHIILRIVQKPLDKTSLDQGVVQFLHSVLKVVLYGLLCFIIASNLGLDTTSIATLLASVGVAIGLALQGSLSNFAGGTLILITKPFKVGDYIIEHNSGLQGTVKEIQIFYTKLLTIDNKLVVIPNGTLSNGSISNCSSEQERRVDMLVGIAYSADLQKAKEILWELVHNDTDVLQEHEGNMVYVADLDSSSVQMGVRVWCLNEHYWDVKFRMTEQIKLEFDKNGIEIPFPQIVVHQTEAKKES